jgi:acetolactate decarboxylase
MRTALFFISVLLIACSPGSDQEKGEQTAASNSVDVHHAGALKLMMHQGDISAKADLDSLKVKKHLYALGALAELKGEILILDGEAFISYQEGFNLGMDNSFDHEATLLVYAEVEEWQKIKFPQPISDLEELEVFVEQTAYTHGIDTSKAFPFMLHGAPGKIDYHVINWPEGDTVHSHEKHVNSGITGNFVNTDMTILGFYSRHHHAIFTHHSTNMHMHFLSEDKSTAGHVDDMIPGEDLELWLPSN